MPELALSDLFKYLFYGSELALSDLFEYLFHGSTANINMCILTFLL